MFIFIFRFGILNCVSATSLMNSSYCILPLYYIDSNHPSLEIATKLFHRLLAQPQWQAFACPWGCARGCEIVLKKMVGNPPITYDKPTMHFSVPRMHWSYSHPNRDLNSHEQAH